MDSTVDLTTNDRVKHRVSKFRLLVLALIAILPSFLMRPCYRLFFGYRVGRRVRVGFSIIDAAECVIEDDVQIGHHCIIANSAGIAGHVEIGNYVTIEGMVGIQQFVKIGNYAFVGGDSTVRKDIPPYIRASRTKDEFCAYIGVNTIGLNRRGFQDKEIEKIEEIYKVLYIRNKNFTKGQKEIEETLEPSNYRTEILEFIQSSKSGIIKGMI